LDLVFERFRQSTSGGQKPVGTGLGLPISRQIIENFGGRIRAESDYKKGATLCFDLPRHDQADAEKPGR
jgi:signal transduction histidine kinase